jgi:hypothetical protein
MLKKLVLFFNQTPSLKVSVMSQNTRNRQGEGPGNTGRSLNDNRGGSRYEGFEGMNFEQRRPAYHPQKASNKDKDNREGGGEGNRREDV